MQYNVTEIVDNGVQKAEDVEGMTKRQNKGSVKDMLREARNPKARHVLRKILRKL